MRHDGDITGDRIMRLTVPKAAGALGISAEAVRQRIKRGTLPTEKDDEGTVFVLLDADRTRTNADRSSDIALMQAHLDSVQEQVSYLKAVIHTRDEELRRKDHIIAALTERIPELEAPREARESPETATQEQEGVEATLAERRSWWRRFFGIE